MHAMAPAVVFYLVFAVKTSGWRTITCLRLKLTLHEAHIEYLTSDLSGESKKLAQEVSRFRPTRQLARLPTVRRTLLGSI